MSIRESARQDLAAARDWYNGQRSGLGDEFLAAASEAFTRIEESAEQFPIYYRDFRRAITRRFPYKIFFRTDGKAAVVFRVLHAAQEHRRRLR